MAFHEFYEIDKETGFLTIKPNTRIKNGVTAQQKVDFLQSFRSTFNFTKAASFVGLNSRTIRDHLKGDSKFGLEYTEAKKSVCDECRGALFAFIHKNPTAAFGILKAYEPEIWRERHTPLGPNKEDRLKQLYEENK